MRANRTLLVAASIVTLRVTAGHAPASAEAPADKQDPQRGRGGSPGAPAMFSPKSLGF
jgi:hypothetical protein